MKKLLIILFIVTSIFGSNKFQYPDLYPQPVNTDSMIAANLPYLDTASFNYFPPIELRPSDTVRISSNIKRFDSGAVIISLRTGVKAQYYKLLYESYKGSYNYTSILYNDFIEKAYNAEDFYVNRINTLEKSNQRTFMEKHGFKVGFGSATVLVILAAVLTFNLVK